MKNRKKGFTLIELIAVLVIMAILALIVTPLVMSIIRKAKVSADKRSIDAYGRSIELAIAEYLLDTGTFPTSIEQLTVEYNGDEVVCSQTQIKSDSSVYLAGCTVGGRNIDGYTYGKEETVTYDAYEIGDEVTYNNVDYRVIKDSNASESTVTLLKSEPIKSTEISSYLTSTEVASKVNTSGTYAEMAYYSAENCVSGGNSSGCSTDYSVSDVKQLVDVWKTNYASSVIAARIPEVSDFEELGYVWGNIDTSGHVGWIYTSDVPSWVYNNFDYWSSMPLGDSDNQVFAVSRFGSMEKQSVTSSNNFVRPVIILPKSAIIS